MQQAALIHIGTYSRDLGASLDRMFENALDWEHLPHLHSSSFGSIRLLQSDATGWRAESTLPGRADQLLTLDLRLNRETGVWVTQTMQGDTLLGEIRTTATATGHRTCHIAAEFHLPGIAPDLIRAASAYYMSLYATLYDEDEAMMIARQASLDAPDKGWRETGGYRIPNACPHLGLPLTADPDLAGIVTCPWHGFRFDAATGRCVSGAACGWGSRAST